MHICIFNPEHDLCLAKGRAHYVPPRSAVEFAMRDARLMQPLYPDATCFSVYDERLPSLLPMATRITAWGWDAVVRWELHKRGAPVELLPTEEQIGTIRHLQHRSTILPLQPDCTEVQCIGDMEQLLQQRGHWVMKAPWSGAGRGLRWVHGELTAIDRDWLQKTVAAQRCVVAEPRRDVVADFALEYVSQTGMLHFVGYSLFSTGSGVYKANLPLSDAEIERRICSLSSASWLSTVRHQVEWWLTDAIAPSYSGPLGIDLMVDANGDIYVAEMNLRHTMGMVAHAQVGMQALD